MKMEEERLVLVREGKEHRDRNRELDRDNRDMRDRIGMFERELEELQD